MILNSEPWVAKAACAVFEVEPDIFFPDQGGGGTKDARLICDGCPVVNECLEYSLTTRQRHGIWGGLNETERAYLLRRKRKLQAVRS